MDSETITEVALLESGELLLVIEGSGKPMYQYIYRQAAGVYWDSDRNGFKSTPIREWSVSKWFSHILNIVRSELGVELKLGGLASWVNIYAEEAAEIKREHAI